ncbi:hypothetical protein BN3662_01846 [Clostridiales bacterium CHKCI006]|nr:hypothetical protein BN3662_01846 [Clostridiales bacterium CHKCI006]
MWTTFMLSYHLKMTYRINTILYVLQHFPLIRRFFPNRLYGFKWLKVLAFIVSLLMELIGVLFGSWLYVWMLVTLVSAIPFAPPASLMLHLFIFLSLIGGIINTPLFQADINSYYAIILLKMNPRKRTLSEFLYYTLTRLIALLTALTFIASSLKLPIYLLGLLPCLMLATKFTFGYLSAAYHQQNQISWREQLPFALQMLLLIGLLAGALVPCFLGCPLPYAVSLALSGLMILLGAYHFKKLWYFQNFLTILKPALTNNARLITNKNRFLKENVSKQITFDRQQTSSKQGFAYLHELFVKRHSKILKSSAHRLSLVLSIVFTCLILLTFLLQQFYSNNYDPVYWQALSALPFMMYLVNRGPRYTQALFFNCDVALLNYRIYRRPEVILGMFKQRLKTLMLLNLEIALVISYGCLGTLYVLSPNQTLLTYCLVGLLPIGLAVFFSMHDLVLYYLLQPYNAKTEVKSGLYSLLRQLTYLLCLFLMNLDVPLNLYGSALLGFCFIYALISLILVYHFSPRTFKLRI